MPSRASPPVADGGGASSACRSSTPDEEGPTTTSRASKASSDVGAPYGGRGLAPLVGRSTTSPVFDDVPARPRSGSLGGRPISLMWNDGGEASRRAAASAPTAAARPADAWDSAAEGSARDSPALTAEAPAEPRQRQARPRSSNMGAPRTPAAKPQSPMIQASRARAFGREVSEEAPSFPGPAPPSNAEAEDAATRAENPGDGSAAAVAAPAPAQGQAAIRALVAATRPAPGTGGLLPATRLDFPRQRSAPDPSPPASTAGSAASAAASAASAAAASAASAAASAVGASGAARPPAQRAVRRQAGASISPPPRRSGESWRSGPGQGHCGWIRRFAPQPPGPDGEPPRAFYGPNHAAAAAKRREKPSKEKEKAPKEEKTKTKERHYALPFPFATEDHRHGHVDVVMGPLATGPITALAVEKLRGEEGDGPTK